MKRGFEGYRWDAVLLNEAWRPAKSENWETHQRHIFMGAGQYENRHGVVILMNKKWRTRINDIEHINERAINYNDHGKPSSNQADERALSPLGVCWPSHWDNAQDQSRSTRIPVRRTYKNCRRRFQRRIGTRVMELNVSVLDRTHSNKRCTREEIGWSNVWWCRTFTAFNTMYRKTLGKQTIYRSPKGAEKQIGYILIKRKTLEIK